MCDLGVSLQAWIRIFVDLSLWALHILEHGHTEMLVATGSGGSDRLHLI